MPRYFFNVHDANPEFDTQGTDFPDDAAARIAAFEFAAGLLIDEAHLHASGAAWHLEVLDASGGLVCRVDVSVRGPDRDC